MTPTNDGKTKRVIRGFCKDASGSASVESLFWIPIFVFMLVLIVDASFVFHGRTQALRTLQDTNRSFSVGRLTTTAQVKQAVIADLAKFTTRATVTSSITSGIITTQVSFPAIDLMSVGAIDALSGITVKVISKQYVEN